MSLQFSLTKGLSTLGSWEPPPEYHYKMVSSSHFKCPIRNYVHSYSTSPCRTPFLNKSLAVDCPRTEIKTVCTQGTGDHLCARVKVLNLVFRHGQHAQILAWVLEKKSVHIGANTILATTLKKATTSFCIKQLRLLLISFSQNHP